VGSQNVKVLSEITNEYVKGFVYAVLPDGQLPENATLNSRRTAIRAFYTAARAFNLTNQDPTLNSYCLDERTMQQDQ